MQSKVCGRGSGMAFMSQQVCENTTGAETRESIIPILAMPSKITGRNRGLAVNRTQASVRLLAMPDGTDVVKNTAPWWGLLFALAALGCNGAFFLNAPLQRIFPWLSLALAVVALSFLVMGLRLLITRPKVHRGKLLSIVVTVIALLPAGLSMLGFVGARMLPRAAEAPQIGQRVPDFTLPDTLGKPVSLDQLLAASPNSHAPKAVLLIFYRGYW
jgi:hypothetical protein